MFYWTPWNVEGSHEDNRLSTGSPAAFSNAIVIGLNPDSLCLLPLGPRRNLYVGIIPHIRLGLTAIVGIAQPNGGHL